MELALSKIRHEDTWDNPEASIMLETEEEELTDLEFYQDKNNKWLIFFWACYLIGCGEYSLA